MKKMYAIHGFSEITWRPLPVIDLFRSVQTSADPDLIVKKEFAEIIRQIP